MPEIGSVAQEETKRALRRPLARKEKVSGVELAKRASLVDADHHEHALPRDHIASAHRAVRAVEEEVEGLLTREAPLSTLLHRLEQPLVRLRHLAGGERSPEQALAHPLHRAGRSSTEKQQLQVLLDPRIVLDALRNQAAAKAPFAIARDPQLERAEALHRELAGAVAVAVVASLALALVGRATEMKRAPSSEAHQIVTEWGRPRKPEARDHLPRMART
jgi:hypothetical protein